MFSYKPRNFASGRRGHRLTVPSTSRAESKQKEPCPARFGPMKRTFQPSRLVRKRRHGFRARMATRQWPQGPQCPSCARPQAAVRLSRNDGRTSGLMRRLKTRAEFVAVARGRRASRNGIVLQALKTGVEDTGVGFTVTKKAGNAPERSRIKRRLRAAVCACNTAFSSQHDYVVLGRPRRLVCAVPEPCRNP